MSLAADLIESDRAWSECGARLTNLSGAILARMVGFEDLAAGAVVHRVDPGRLAPDPLQWLVSLEALLAAGGMAQARIYLESTDPALSWSLTQLGFLGTEELGFLHPARRQHSDVELLPLADEADWCRKRDLHASLRSGPDGTVVDPDRWVALERARQAAGACSLYLVRRRGEICGTLSLADAGPLLRLRNVVVAPTHRRRGVAAAILRAVIDVAHARRKEALGCFALAGDRNEDLYRESGFAEVIRQVRWDHPIEVGSARLRGRAHAHG